MRKPFLLLGCLAAVVLLGACDGSALGPGGSPQVLVPSAAWQKSVDASVYQSRIGELSAALDELRAETSSGWTGRQDDVTGYLAELTGGSFTGSGTEKEVAAGLLERYGPRLFGVPSDQLTLGGVEQAPGTTIATARAEQSFGGVAVLDATLTVSIDVAREARVTSVSGRVWPELDAPTTVVVTAREARRVATEASGGRADAQPRTVILPTVGGSSQLAWEVVIVGADTPGATAVTLYYVDAIQGTILAAEPGSAEGGYSAARAAPQVAAAPAPLTKGEPVEVTGKGPLGPQLTAHGVRRSDGKIVLADVTTDTYDPSSGKGGVYTFDATGLSEQQIDRLPGRVQEFPSTFIDDPEALAAQTFSRDVYDYYLKAHGRNSWDGKGAPLISSVHFGPPTFCNAFFSSQIAQMVYGVPCRLDGVAQTTVAIDLDVTGHEITHGVTASTSDLNYSAQSGALNESFSDFFGNVIGDENKRADTNTLGEDWCSGLSQPTQSLCSNSDNGVIATRTLSNGTSFDDYLFLLDGPLGYSALGLDQDHGGVHLNSGIWNNALWTIRMRLAQIDGQPAVDSARAEAFTRVVYNALTTKLNPTSGFLDAREAIEQAARDLSVDPTIQRVITEVFDEAKICTGCRSAGAAGARGVATTVATEKSPAVAGNRVAWLDYGQGLALGVPEVETSGGAGKLEAQSFTGSIGFAGDALLAMNGQDGSIVRYTPQGGRTKVGQIADEESFRIGLAGSDDGAAWVDDRAHKIFFVDPSGGSTSAPLPTGVGAKDILTIATGGRTVVLGGKGAAVAWVVGGQPQLLPTGGVTLSVAAYGHYVFASPIASVQSQVLSGPGVLYDLNTGQPTLVSDKASPFGAAMSDRYLVWSENVGVQNTSSKAGASLSYSDTDLYLFSFATGKIYDLVNFAGQQGFPSLSRTTLAWQDTVNGGNDIYAADLPANL